MKRKTNEYVVTKSGKKLKINSVIIEKERYIATDCITGDLWIITFEAIDDEETDKLPQPTQLITRSKPNEIKSL